MKLATHPVARRLTPAFGAPLALAVFLSVLAPLVPATMAAGEPSPAASPSPSPVAAAADAGPALDPGSLLPNGRQPLPGVLTGGQPSRDQIVALSVAGYRTVVNLRGTAEPQLGVADLAREVGLRYVALPVAGAQDLTREKARVLGALLADPTATPLAIYCASGNRAGALLALEQAQVEGVPPAEALAIGMAAGLSGLEARVRELLELPAGK